MTEFDFCKSQSRQRTNVSPTVICFPQIVLCEEDCSLRVCKASWSSDIGRQSSLMKSWRTKGTFWLSGAKTACKGWRIQWKSSSLENLKIGCLRTGGGGIG